MKSYFHFISCAYFSVCLLNAVFGKNTFNTVPVKHSRATTYLPKVASKTCLLKPDPGPCRANITMFYFNPGGMDCSRFQWGGCQGNGNRFDTSPECFQTCLSKPGRSKTRPRWCSLSFDYGFCFGALERWYFDPLWKVCKKTIYSGCGGNKNNFYSKEQCDSICRLGRGVLAKATKSEDGLKKVLIVNPWNTTPSRGKDQTTATITTKTTNN